ncbi:MAG: lecithin retinol acyltransferase family protein [Victivallales bacterium]|nr:lecithin retinol acyltransferase family protein [Victivallales bacterium]MCF7889249.1 lecithin retinol acyltransferase family protein [Victivallales bacterium]
MKIYPKGHLLCVDHGLYEHVGISDGSGCVFENSYRAGKRGKVPLEEFSQGKKIIDIGFLPNSLPADKIISNAENAVKNPEKYNFVFNNCEHFVREICGVDIKSPQIQKAILAAIGTVAALKIRNPLFRTMAVGASTGLILAKYSSKTAIKKTLLGASAGIAVSAAVKIGKYIIKKYGNQKKH